MQSCFSSLRKTVDVFPSLSNLFSLEIFLFRNITLKFMLSVHPEVFFVNMRMYQIRRWIKRRECKRLRRICLSFFLPFFCKYVRMLTDNRD